MEIRVFRFRYLSAIMGMLLGVIFILLGFLDSSPTILFFGLVFVIISGFFIRKHLSYKLILFPGKIEEWQNGKKVNTSFTKISQLDCELIFQFENIVISPIFHLLDNENNIKKLKLNGEASILTISQWVKNYYPEAKISENTQKVLSWKKYSPSAFKFLFSSI